jgi:hypothetical protein
MGRYKPHQKTILSGESSALSLEICLLVSYKVILYALYRPVGTLPEATLRSAERGHAAVYWLRPCWSIEVVPGDSPGPTFAGEMDHTGSPIRWQCSTGAQQSPPESCACSGDLETFNPLSRYEHRPISLPISRKFTSYSNKDHVVSVQEDEHYCRQILDARGYIRLALEQS